VAPHPAGPFHRNEVTMASFQSFLPILLRFEGGFVDDPADPGGATNKGITLQTFHANASQLLGVEPTLENLKNLSDVQAATLYKVLYWDRARGDDIGLQPLADLLVDFYVNAGGNAFKVLQQVLNNLGTQPPLAVDGGMGPSTLRAMQGMDPAQVYRDLRQGRIGYYEELVRKRPPLERFLKGWLNRVAAFPVL
jgi:lysozyme family protein